MRCLCCSWLARCWYCKYNIAFTSTDSVYTVVSVDSSILQDTLVAHTDAVWGLAIHSTRVQLLSCSADGTVRLWSPGLKMQLNHTYSPPTEGMYTLLCLYFLLVLGNGILL